MCCGYSCLRQSEQRRGLPLTQSLNIIGVKRSRSKVKESQKRRNHVIKSTPVVSQLPVGWNTVLVRQQRARKRHNTISSSCDKTTQQLPSSCHDKLTTHNIKQNTSQSPTTDKQENVTVQATASWWSILVGYTLGAVYGSYNGVISYFVGDNDTTDNVLEDGDCDPHNVLLTTDPLLLVRKCLNRNINDETVEHSSLFNSLQTAMPQLNTMISKVMEAVQCYTGSYATISLFEDALMASDYDGRSLLPAGTVVEWSPQHYSSSKSAVQCERDDDCSEWQLVHKSNDTSLYVRPYKDTDLSQYRGVYNVME